MSPTVLQLVSSSGFYGAERVLVELATFLHQQGWSSHVGALVGAGSRGHQVIGEARRRGLTTTTFPCGSGFDTRAMAAIRRYVEDNGVDIVHSHGYKSNIFLFLSGAHRRARLISTCHNWLTDSLKLMIYELLDKLMLHQFHKVVAVSPPLEQELASAGIPAERIEMVENGLALDAPRRPRDEVRQSLGVEPTDPLLVSVGRLDPWKAFDVLLQAFVRVAGQTCARLLLVGDGDLQADLKAQASELGIAERVIMPGYRRDIADLLHASDLYVISSRKEGLPMVLLEAMAAGLPVVATSVGAIPRVIEGLLVPPDDPDALAKGILRLLDDPKQAHDLALRTQQKHREHFSREAMGERYLRLYQRLLVN